VQRLAARRSGGIDFAFLAGQVALILAEKEHVGGLASQSLETSCDDKA